MLPRNAGVPPGLGEWCWILATPAGIQVYRPSPGLCRQLPLHHGHPALLSKSIPRVFLGSLPSTYSVWVWASLSHPLGSAQSLPQQEPNIQVCQQGQQNWARTVWNPHCHPAQSQMSSRTLGERRDFAKLPFTLCNL